MAASASAVPGGATLDAVLDVAAASPLAAMLGARRGADLDLDASGVERVNGLCLQVLLSAAKTWTADGARLSLRHPSAALLQVLRITGAEDLEAIIAKEDLQ